jgi:hemerythrin-like domain-containing protein
VQRDPRLHGLSSDHHHALVLSWRLRHEIRDAASAKAWLARARTAFSSELRPHFTIEEEELLPALREAGEHALVDRTLAEHAALADTLAAADVAAPREALERFAQLLQAHVRFEENELFPACEAKLPADVLERVARRAPKPSPRRRGGS